MCTKEDMKYAYGTRLLWGMAAAFCDIPRTYIDTAPALDRGL